MAKVLIVNPVIRAEDDPRHVPYGLALLAGAANREGHKKDEARGGSNAIAPSQPADANPLKVQV